MDLGLKNKVVVVAGSSRGIGQGIANGFLKEGCKVTLTGRGSVSLGATHKAFAEAFGPDVNFFTGDMGSEITINTCLSSVRDALGRIDILVSCMGSGRPMPVEKTVEENLLCNLRFVSLGLDYLIDGGTILLISSIAGLAAIDAPSAYSASKSALNMFSKSMSRDLVRRNIRINVISPGNIWFPDGGWANKQKQDAEEVYEYLRTNVPMNKFGSPEDIGNAAVFLCSDKAKYITGANLVVDGGQNTAL